MDLVDAITRVDPQSPDSSVTPDRIVSMRVASDAD